MTVMPKATSTRLQEKENVKATSAPYKGDNVNGYLRMLHLWRKCHLVRISAIRGRICDPDTHFSMQQCMSMMRNHGLQCSCIHLMESTKASAAPRANVCSSTKHCIYRALSRMAPQLRSKQMTSRRALNTFMSEFEKLTGTEWGTSAEAAVEGKYRMATSDECAEIRRAIDHVRLKKERQKLKRAAELARKREEKAKASEEAAAAAKAAKEERARKLAEKKRREKARERAEVAESSSGSSSESSSSSSESE